jgi:nitrogen fixation NifU-like protein
MERQKPMTEAIDKFVQKVQKKMLEGYSENLKNEFLNPQNLGRIDHCDSHVSVTGVCGDTVEMYLLIRYGTIRDIKFVTDGCGFTIACASYVTRTAKGRTIEETLRISPEDVDTYFEGLPEEHKHCAKLSVMTLRAAIENYRSKLARTSEKGKVGDFTA